MSIIILGFMIAFAIFASADGTNSTKVVRCKSTFRSMNDPACSMRTENPNNEMMCTNVDVFANVGGYFSVGSNVEPLCITYIFKSIAGLGGDDYPDGIWLFRSAIFDPILKTCENICKFVRESQGNLPYKNFYMGCFNATDGNDDDVDSFWHQHTQYDCSNNSMYYTKGKPVPNEVLTTPDPTTPTKTTFTTTRDTTTTSAMSTTSSATSTRSTMSTTSATTSATSTRSTTSFTSEKPTTPTPIDPDEQKATLYVGVAEGVVGVVGTAFIVTSNVVLFLQLQKVRG